MKNGYFHRVAEMSPSRFWINNPTREEAEQAIVAGATGCTLNPSYTQKMIDHPSESAYALSILDKVLDETSDDVAAAAEFQRRIARGITEKFLPMFEISGGEIGYVSIQADPLREHDPRIIIDEGRVNRAVNRNVCCKVPLTEAGLVAIETLLKEGTAVNATEIFAIRQALDLGELYERVIPKGATRPKLWYSHIAGIYDDYLNNYVREHEIEIAPDLLAQAGLAIAKKLYAIVKERGFRMSFIGGGARQTWHFTELVGGEVNLTINWKGTADKLIEMDQPVVWRIHNPVPYAVVEELSRKLPDWDRGWREDGISQREYEEFGPVELFRSSFVKSWDRVLDVIKERRR